MIPKSSPRRLRALAAATLVTMLAVGACASSPGLPAPATLSSPIHLRLLARPASLAELSIGVRRGDRPLRAPSALFTRPFSDPFVRGWAESAPQMDLVDYEVVILHGLPWPPPPAIMQRLGAPLALGPSASEYRELDGYTPFTHVSGKWLFVRSEAVTTVRRWLASGGAAPSPIEIPSDVSQVVLIPSRDTAPGTGWLMFVSKTNGDFITWAREPNDEAAARLSDAWLVPAPREKDVVTVDRSGRDVFMVRRPR